jgi:endonuclease/exonuclease/phosphatase family metal-dependent hydrolase
MRRGKRVSRGLSNLTFIFITTLAITANARFGDICNSLLAGRTIVKGAEVVDISRPQALERNHSRLKDRAVTVMSYNVENLFLSPHNRDHQFAVGDQFSEVRVSRNGVRFRKIPGRRLYEKSHWKLNAITRVIASQTPDIVVLQEVENLSALELLNRESLYNEYEPYLENGNDRILNIGFLVRKGLDIKVELLSHKDTIATDPVSGQNIKIFSRDLPALIVKDKFTDEPLFIVFGHHGKSKRNRSGDHESNKLRRAQLATAAKIIQAFTERYPGVGIIMAGDFNTKTTSSPEMLPIKHFMKSAFDVAPDTIPVDQRVTHAFFPQKGSPNYHQLDDFFVTSTLWNSVISADILQYTDGDGNPRGLPKSFKERTSQPSDHFAIVMKFKIP